jgi:transcriptional regulator with XRE-family HTH domain
MVITEDWMAAVLGGADPIDVEVGINLRQARKTKGFSQMQLADTLGMSFQQVQKYERGANRVSASVLVKAARALEISPLALLPPDTPTERSATTLNTLTDVRGADTLIAAYARIKSPKLRRAVLNLALALADESPAGHEGA